MGAWDTALQLRAWRERKAVRAAATSHVLFVDDPWILCPLSMAGEDPSLHAVLLGPASSGGQLLMAPDPRSHRHRLELFSQVGRRLGEYFQECYQDDRAPQILVPSGSAIGLLVGLADYLTYLKPPEEGGKQLKEWTEDANQLGRWLQFYLSRREVSGQQSILDCYELLEEHWAFGQDLYGHLGAALEWIEPGEGDLFHRVEEIQQKAMGVRTPAELDQAELHPALEAWAKVERGSSKSLASFRRQEIEDMLSGVLRPIWQACQKTLALLSDLPTLPGTDQMMERERQAFERHMQHLDEGGNFARQDSSRRAVFRLAEWEDAKEQYGWALVWGDALSRERAVLEGEVVRGELSHLPTDERQDLWVLESAQPWLRVRVGDELVLMNRDNPQMCLVEGMSRKAGHLRLLLASRAKNGGLPEGEVCDWASGMPDWYRMNRERGKIARNLQEMPLTHQEAEEGAPPKMPEWKNGMDDPLAGVEALR